MKRDKVRRERVREMRATQRMDPEGELREIRKEGVEVQKRLAFPPLFICRHVWLLVWLPF